MATTAALSLTAEYQSKAFDLRTVGKYRLVLHLAPQRAQYVVLSDLYEVLAFREYVDGGTLPLVTRLDGVAYKDPLLQERFASVDILLNEPRWMLVPAMHAPAGTEQAYLGSQYEVGAADTVLRDPVRTVGAHLLYAVASEVPQRADQLFQNSHVRHAVSPMLVEAQRLHYALRSPHSCGVLVVDGGVQVFVTGLFGLLLANEYPATSAGDVTDIVRRAVDAAALPVEDIKVYVVGRGALREQLDAELPNHFPNLTSVRPYFAGQPGLNQAGIYHDEFLHLLQRMS